MRYTQDAIEHFLPHRAPFLFATAVDIIEAGKSGSAKIVFADKEEFWQGDKNLTPSEGNDFLLLEAAAQVFGIVLASGNSTPGSSPEGKHLLLGFDNCEIMAEFNAGAECTISVNLDGVFGSMFKGSFTAQMDAANVARGELTVMQGAN